jgi:hypothetical protein
VRGAVSNGRPYRERIIGPVGSVVSFFDDQQFRTDQNSLQITKTVDGPIEVPIAQDLLSGEQNSGMYMGSRPGFNWVFSKQMEQHPWLDIIKNGVEWVVQSILDHFDDTEHATVSGTQGDIVDGFVPKNSGGRSSNNHVDNLSSIRFGGEPLLVPSSVVARILAR